MFFIIKKKLIFTYYYHLNAQRISMAAMQKGISDIFEIIH